MQDGTPPLPLSQQICSVSTQTLHVPLHPTQTKPNTTTLTLQIVTLQKCTKIKPVLQFKFSEKARSSQFRNPVNGCKHAVVTACPSVL